MKLNKKQREELRMKFGGRCAYCGEILTARFHVDHVEPVLRNISKSYAMERPENNTLENLYPACIPCNLYKASCSVELFRERIATQVDVTRRASRSYRTAEVFGLVKPTGTPVVFWFEKYQREDAA
ncbi:MULTISPECIES: HNH endonuclease [unclassified Symbiopectobacterium]|uniref:HNH endonuclease n=1 Tax=unclassified Symbiopectobacterium TaxID=2794573 RepID=UPI0022263B77|nr:MULTISPECIES: HNH endonuclease [unclassified Symbiopectobacterium]MCW2473403.1 HNH endonuclease [Candidatus Symbiopectobacterium sp. NZEC151]MCW2482749.1 HNH endonuclease [Candidatus Symbiopectobacterium sp. NZEC135]